MMVSAGVAIGFVVVVFDVIVVAGVVVVDVGEDDALSISYKDDTPKSDEADKKTEKV